jgi:hypothetical protein
VGYLTDIATDFKTDLKKVWRAASGAKLTGLFAV